MFLIIYIHINNSIKRGHIKTKLLFILHTSPRATGCDRQRQTDRGIARGRYRKTDTRHTETETQR